MCGERNSAGVVSCEVDCGAAVGSEAKGRDGCGRVKLHIIDLATSMLHGQ